ncbi:hypothetical protein LZ32DRAFT_622664 [Colletotrichum eremochloae]|nr:hypothetical protein LZ32DRAFT_622664 [Colletotrichum eremochloae]
MTRSVYGAPVAGMVRMKRSTRDHLTCLCTCMGCSLIAQLLGICFRKEGTRFQLRLNIRLKELVAKDGRVCGAIVESGDGRIDGFARSETLRALYLPHTTGVEWTLTQPEGDLGSACEKGLRRCQTKPDCACATRIKLAHPLDQ